MSSKTKIFTLKKDEISEIKACNSIPLQEIKKDDSEEEFGTEDTEAEDSGSEDTEAAESEAEAPGVADSGTEDTGTAESEAEVPEVAGSENEKSF